MDEVGRDLESLRLPTWGRVVPADGVVPWLVVDPAGGTVEPVRQFLRDFVARGNTPGIRCPMLRVDPRQRRRLGEIVVNLRDRIAEARENGWLGEIEGLQVSLDAAKAKMASLARADPARAAATDLGIPTIPESR